MFELFLWFFVRFHIGCDRYTSYYAQFIFSDTILPLLLSPNFGTQMKPLAPELNHQNQKDIYKYSQRSVMWQTACAAFCSNSTRATPSLLLTYFSPATHLISHLRRNDTFSADRELFFRPPTPLPKLTSTFWGKGEKCAGSWLVGSVVSQPIRRQSLQ